VRDGRAEDGHHRVADELLDRPAETLDVCLDPFVVGPERRADVLRVRPIGPVRETDKVDEEDGDDLALLAEGRSVLEGNAARETEAGMFRVLLPAREADLHPAGSSQRRARTSTGPLSSPSS
jgi:hypothetical protein